MRSEKGSHRNEGGDAVVFKRTTDGRSCCQCEKLLNLAHHRLRDSTGVAEVEKDLVEITGREVIVVEGHGAHSAQHAFEVDAHRRYRVIAIRRHHSLSEGLRRRYDCARFDLVRLRDVSLQSIKLQLDATGQLRRSK